MSSVPKVKLNTGALIPAVGMNFNSSETHRLSLFMYVGLGGWGGVTKEERAGTVNWILTALEV